MVACARVIRVVGDNGGVILVVACGTYGQHSISASGLSNFKVDYQNTDQLFQLVPHVILYSEVVVFRFTI
ncbi:hypothetical protein VNO77_03892 [Canavalia gladiata]|uniref:Uncharacterized protein n=1 Tax=Canavalia gladiata TaxID=3824 RepID=A0AAN9N204_CANGL